MSIERLKSPDRLQKESNIAALFAPESTVDFGDGELPFYEYISEVLGNMKVSDRDDVLYGVNNQFRGTLSEYLALAQTGTVSRFSLLRRLAEVEHGLEHPVADVSVPLSYLGVMKFSGETITSPDLLREYARYYDALDDADKQFFRQRDEIAILHQSPNAKRQAVVEAVANGIDALRDVSIGEKGLGIKQALAYLEGSGEISVVTRTIDGTAYTMRTVRAADGEYHQQIQEIEDVADMVPCGTELRITPAEPLSDEAVEELIATIRYKFRPTRSAAVFVNGEHVNDFSGATDEDGGVVDFTNDVGRVEVEVINECIIVKDAGRGMGLNTLAGMFVPRGGTKLLDTQRPVESSELVRTYFMGEQVDESVTISRKGEALELTAIDPSRYLNVCTESIIIDASRLRVPEARQSVFVDQEFFAALQTAAERVMQGERALEKKLRFLNSICAYVDELKSKKGVHDEAEGGEIAGYVYDLKQTLKGVAQELIDEASKAYTLLPNDPVFTPFGDGAVIFLDNELFDFHPEQVPGVERASLFAGDTVYVFRSNHGEDALTAFEYGEHVFINQALIDAYEATEEGSTECDYLHELLELALNPVDTSYDQNRKGKERENVLSLSKSKREQLHSADAEEIGEKSPEAALLRNRFEHRIVKNIDAIGAYDAYAYQLAKGFLVERQGFPLTKRLTYYSHSFDEITSIPPESVSECSDPYQIETTTWCIPTWDSLIFLEEDGDVKGGYKFRNGHVWDTTKVCATENGYFVIETLADGKLEAVTFDKQFNLEKTNQIEVGSVMSSMKSQSLTGLHSLSDGSFILVLGEDSEKYSPKTPIHLSAEGVVMNMEPEFSGKVLTSHEFGNEILFVSTSGLCRVAKESGEAIGEHTFEFDGEIGDSVLSSRGDAYVLSKDRLLVFSRAAGYAMGKRYPVSIGEGVDANKFEIRLNSEENKCALLNYCSQLLVIDLDTGLTHEEPAKKNGGYVEIFANTSGSFTTVTEQVDFSKSIDLGILELTSFSDQIKQRAEHINLAHHVEQLRAEISELCAIEADDEVYKQSVRRTVQQIVAEEGDQSLTLEGVFPLEGETSTLLLQELTALRTRQRAISDAYKVRSLSPEVFLGKSGQELAVFLSDRNPDKVVFLARAIDSTRDLSVLLPVLGGVYECYSASSFNSDRDRSLFFGLLDAYTRSVAGNPEQVVAFSKKVLRLRQSSAYETFRTHLEGEYDGRPVISYLGKEKDEAMPAKTFLEYLERDGSLEMRVGQEFVPEDAEDVLFLGEVPSSALYYHGRRGKVSDGDLSDVLERFAAEYREIPQPTQALLQEQVKKEIHGQASENGVHVRELLQNMIDAARRANRIDATNSSDQSRLEVECFEEVFTHDEHAESYYVEKYRDHGSGIPGLVDLLVAQINTKGGNDTAGFFGSGFLSVFEDADVVTIKTSDGSGQTRYIDIHTVRDEVGEVSDFTVQQYKQRAEAFVGTEIARKKLLQAADIPEMEYAKTKAALVRNTRLLDAALPSGEKIKVNLDEKQLESATAPIFETQFTANDRPYSVKLYEGKFSQVASGFGLRMGDLEEKYTALVPAQIRDLVVEKKLSLVVDGDIKLIKDRSAMADESTYLPGVQCAVGTAVIKLSINELFETGRKFEGWPDDYLSNLGYAYVYDGEEGERIVDIARQLNGGQELSVEDLQFLSVEGNDLTSRLARLAVLTNIQVVGDNGVAVETSLATKRSQVMVEAASHSELASVRRKLEAEREMLGQFGVRTLDGDDVDSALDQSVADLSRIMRSQKAKIQKVDLDDPHTLSDQERLNYLRVKDYVKAIYGDSVKLGIEDATEWGGRRWETRFF